MIIPDFEHGLGLFFGGIGIGLLLMFAGRGGWRHISIFGLTFQRPREATPEERAEQREDARATTALERRQIEIAFLRFSEAAVSMVSMIEAPGPADRSLSAWFDVLAAAVAAAITVRPEDHFRVAIWADLGDPLTFALLGAANHDRNDRRMDHLSKDGTIAGRAWRSKAGEYLCVDIAKDRKFKARSATPRPYKSIFAIRVGEHAPGWGVMTIDGPHVGSFGALQLQVIRRFARLASAGAAVATSRYGPRPLPAPRGPSVTVSTAPVPRIVASSDDGPPTSEEGS